jgi:hypothetical protein
VSDQVRVLYDGPADAFNDDVARETGGGSRLEPGKTYVVSEELADRLCRSSVFFRRAKPEPKQQSKEELLEEADRLGVDVKKSWGKDRIAQAVADVKATADAGDPDQPGEVPAGGDPEAPVTGEMPEVERV